MSRSTWRSGLPALLLLASLAIAIVFSALWRAEAGTGIRGSLRNTRPEGASQLKAQLAAWGYVLNEDTQEPLTFSENIRILFVLGVNRPFDPIELYNLDRWVRAGGALIVAQDRPGAQQLLNFYHVGLVALPAPVASAPLKLPALNWPRIAQVQLNTSWSLKLNRQDVAIHIGDCSAPFLVSFGLEQGRVFILSSLYPFTNQGLEDADTAQLVSNLAHSVAPAGSLVAVDETHHLPQQVVLSPQWFFSTSEGWGLLYGLGILLIYLLASGRHFGPPLLSHAQQIGRTTADFIQTLAEMRYRLGEPQAIRRHYWRRKKRLLAHQHQLDATLPDAEFLEALSPFYPASQIDSLRRLIDRLDDRRAGEHHLTRWVGKMIQWQ